MRAGNLRPHARQRPFLCLHVRHRRRRFEQLLVQASRLDNSCTLFSAVSIENKVLIEPCSPHCTALLTCSPNASNRNARLLYSVNSMPKCPKNISMSNLCVPLMSTSLNTRIILATSASRLIPSLRTMVTSGAFDWVFLHPNPAKDTRKTNEVHRRGFADYPNHDNEIRKHQGELVRKKLELSQKGL